MKTIFFLFALTILQANNWEPNFDNALKVAKADNKLILLNFSGSDWCGPCIYTKKNYFENEVFMAMANENLVMVNADFPRKKVNKLSDIQEEQNNKLADKYNSEGSFPLTLILDADGKVLKIYKGKPSMDVNQFTEEIKSICVKSKPQK